MERRTAFTTACPGGESAAATTAAMPAAATSATGPRRRRRLRPVAEALPAQRAGARPVDRAVDDDPVQPRAERASAVEAVERAHRGEERLLRDVLGRGGVADDEQRRTVRARPVTPKELLERLRRAALSVTDERPLSPLAGHRQAQPESARIGGHRPYTVTQAWQVR